MEINNIAIARIEQLYPFPFREVNYLLQSYPNASEVIWCQEEPKNQGAWYRTAHRLERCLMKHQSLSCVSREESPSPAVGNYRVHLVQQQKLITEALTLSKKTFSKPEQRSTDSHAS